MGNASIDGAVNMAVMPADTPLVAPAMSTSSSRASNLSDLWSAASSRRGSNASSVTPPSASDVDFYLSSKKHVSSTVSGGVSTSAQTAESRPSPPHTVQTPSASLRRPLKYTTDPLERSYPEPEVTIDLGAALAREPLKWSLGHWKKNARDLTLPSSTQEASRQRFEDTKNELRRAQRDMAASRPTR
ncbi:hypothetical protein SEPCBS119000_000713 [Sporothrix epigloea]|uniref:Uncharacterized protein n=1 Tax=Sporothrix epigloea TaxID=1892477 RepID=A0ABP0D6L6_9PEZI